LARVAIAIGCALLLVAGALVLVRMVDSGGDSTVSTTTLTEPVVEGCGDASASSPAPVVEVGPPRWQAGTVGEVAGISPGGEIAYDPVAEIETQLDAIASSGARWIRIDVSWTAVEKTEGRFDWCRTDRMVLGARARGLDVLAVPAYAPAWASGLDELHGAPADPADFGRFVAAAARRYVPAGVVAWEIWNEPNVASFWKPAPDPEAYVAVLRAGAAAVREVAADATVLTGGLAPAADREDGSSIAIDTFIEGMYAAGAAGSFDAVAIHPYSVPARPLEAHDWNPFTNLPRYHELLAAHGDGAVPIWLTEFGAPTGSGDPSVHEDIQSDFVEEAFGAVAEWPWAGPLLWYSLRDLGEDAFDVGQNWGLLRNDFEPKPAYGVFQALMGEPRSA
jgi:hypothetical protein